MLNRASYRKQDVCMLCKHVSIKFEYKGREIKTRYFCNLNAPDRPTLITDGEIWSVTLEEREAFLKKRRVWEDACEVLSNWICDDFKKVEKEND